MDHVSDIDILNTIGEPAVLEQLAEEASELSQAASKMARFIRQENPTPKSESECFADLIEEYTDVINCIQILDIKFNEYMLRDKRARWKYRIYDGYRKNNKEDKIKYTI